jgi:hypothetical protein
LIGFHLCLSPLCSHARCCCSLAYFFSRQLSFLQIPSLYHYYYIFPFYFFIKMQKQLQGLYRSPSPHMRSKCVRSLARSFFSFSPPHLRVFSFARRRFFFLSFFAGLQSFSLKDSDEDIFACAPPLQNECLARSASALSRSNKTQRKAHMLERSGGNELSLSFSLLGEKANRPRQRAHSGISILRR